MGAHHATHAARSAPSYQIVARLILIAGTVVLLSALAPWADGDPVFGPTGGRPIPGIVVRAGQVAVLAGGVAVVAGWRLRRRGLRHARHALVGAGFAFGTALLIGSYYLLDIRRLAGDLPVSPIEGWQWFEVAWGLPVMTGAAAVGLLGVLWAYRQASRDEDRSGSP